MGKVGLPCGFLHGNSHLSILPLMGIAFVTGTDLPGYVFVNHLDIDTAGFAFYPRGAEFHSY